MMSLDDLLAGKAGSPEEFYVHLNVLFLASSKDRAPKTVPMPAPEKPKQTVEEMLADYRAKLRNFPYAA